MKKPIIALAISLFASQAAFAQCTPAEVDVKARQLAERVNQLTESNPERAREINEEIRQMEAKRTADQLGDECEAYERRLQQIEEAEKRADIPPAKAR
jgi:hypothetical protein